MIERVSGSLQWKSTADSFLLTRNALRRFLTHFFALGNGFVCFGWFRPSETFWARFWRWYGCCLWCVGKKSPSKEGISPELLSMRNWIMEVSNFPTDAKCLTVIEGDRKVLAIVLTWFFADDNFLFAVHLMILSAFLALAATAKPSPWSVDARNAQEFCSASPVPNQWIPSH